MLANQGAAVDSTNVLDTGVTTNSLYSCVKKTEGLREKGWRQTLPQYIRTVTSFSLIGPFMSAIIDVVF